MKHLKKSLITAIAMVLCFPIFAQAAPIAKAQLTTQDVVDQSVNQPLQTMNAKKDYFNYYLPIGFQRLTSQANELYLSANGQNYLLKIDLAQAYREFIALRANEINEFYKNNADSAEVKQIEVSDPFAGFYNEKTFEKNMIIFHTQGLIKTQASDVTPYAIYAVRATPDSHQLVVKAKVGSVVIQTSTTYERLESSIQDVMLLARNVLVDTAKVAVNEYQYSAKLNLDYRNSNRAQIPTEGQLVDLTNPEQVNATDLSKEVEIIEDELERSKESQQQQQNNEDPTVDPTQSAPTTP